MQEVHERTVVSWIALDAQQHFALTDGMSKVDNISRQAFCFTCLVQQIPDGYILLQHLNDCSYILLDSACVRGPRIERREAGYFGRSQRAQVSDCCGAS